MANKKGAGIGVPGTPMLASHFSIPPINTPLPSIFGKNHVELCVRNLCKNREKKQGNNRVKSKNKIKRENLKIPYKNGKKKKSLSLSLGNPTQVATSFLLHCIFCG